LKAQGQQAIQREATQKTTLRTTAHLPANQSSILKSMVASDVETNTTAALHAQPHMKTEHFQKVCMKKRLEQVYEIVQNPQYQGQEIHLHNDNDETGDSSSTNGCDEDEDSDSEPIMVF